MTNSSYITTESGGRQNIFPTEPRPYVDQSVSYDGYPQNAEKVNGRWAMIGLVALLGAYVTTGQINWENSIRIWKLDLGEKFDPSGIRIRDRLVRRHPLNN